MHTVFDIYIMVKIQNKRRQRRSRGSKKNSNILRVQYNKGIYGPVIRNITLKYTKFGNVNASSSLVHGLIGMKLAIGNDIIFSGPNEFYKNFHEYKILRAEVVVHCTHLFSAIVAPSETIPQHLHYASRFCVILRDYDAGASDSFRDFNDAVSTPGSKHRTFTNYQVGTVRANWAPTEATDTDWRLTHNDGAFYVYVLLQTPVGTFADKWLSLSYNVEVITTFHISVRAIQFNTSSKTVHHIVDTNSNSSDEWLVTPAMDYDAPP